MPTASGIVLGVLSVALWLVAGAVTGGLAISRRFLSVDTAIALLTARGSGIRAEPNMPAESG